MTQAADNAGADNNNGAGDGQGAGAVQQHVPRGLDEVHAAMQQEHGEEFLVAEDDNGGSGDDNGAAGTGDDGGAGDAGDGSGAAGDGDGAGSGDDAGAAGAGDGSDAGAGGDGGDAGAGAGDEDENAGAGQGAPADPVEIPTPEAPTIDNDIEKPGDYKAEFVDIDGKKYYVSDMDQLPDDFEPKNQKEYGKSIQALTREQGKYDAAQSQYAQDKAKFDNQTTVSTLQKSWADSITKLTESKTLPEDKAERDKVVKAVFGLMESEMAKGNVVDNFAVAHELYMSREGKRIADEQAATAAAEAAEKKKQEEAERKKAGGRVMGGGGGSSTAGGGSGGGSRGGRVIEFKGGNLDDAHQRVMGSL